MADFQGYSNNTDNIHIDYKFNSYKEGTGAFVTTSPSGFDTNNNLKRLKALQDSGEKGFFFLAIFSFIEGYLRNKYNKQITSVTFVDEYQPSTTNAKSLVSVLGVLKAKLHPSEKTVCIYDKLIAYYHLNASQGDFQRYYFSANRIRHTFTDQPFATDVLDSLNLLSEFAEIHDFKPNEKKLVNNLFNHQLGDKIKQQGELEIIGKILALKDSNTIENLKEIISKNKSLLNIVFPWRIFYRSLSTLTEKQEKAETFILNPDSTKLTGNYLIQGGPGSGKTIILITIFQQLLTRDNKKDIYLLTYTSSLNKYTIYLSKHILFAKNTSVTQSFDDHIKTFDEFLKERARKILNRDIFLPDYDHLSSDDKCKPLIELINKLKKKYSLSDYDSETILNQALNEIWGLLPDKQDYIDQSYSTGTAITNKLILDGRENLWNLVKELEKELEAPDKRLQFPLEYACYKIVTNPCIVIDDGIKVQYLLVDEVQDLSCAKILFITKITRDNYILSGDQAQSLFIRKGLGWRIITELANKEIIKVLTPLTQNFRSNKAIQDIANSFNNKLEIRNKYVTSDGFIPGPVPDYIICSKKEDAIKAMIKRIEFLRKDCDYEKINYNDFCIIAANNEELDLIAEELSKNGIGSENIEKSENPFGQQDLIKLNTVKYIKGIDCSIIMLLLTEDFVDKMKNGNLDKDAQMNGIYSSITRAMNSLSIFIVDTNDITTKDTSIKAFFDVLKDGNVIKYDINMNLFNSETEPEPEPESGLIPQNDIEPYYQGIIDRNPYTDSRGNYILFIQDLDGTKFYACQKDNSHIDFSKLKAQEKVIFKTKDVIRHFPNGTEKLEKHAIEIQIDE